MTIEEFLDIEDNTWVKTEKNELGDSWTQYTLVEKVKKPKNPRNYAAMFNALAIINVEGNVIRPIIFKGHRRPDNIFHYDELEHAVIEVPPVKVKRKILKRTI